MNYYVKTTNTYFVDPHGTPDFGGMKKEVIKSENNIDEELEYFHYDLCPETENYEEKISEFEEEFLEEFGCPISEYEFPCSEDGYNSEYNCSTYRKITLDEYLQFKEIINVYNVI